MPFLRQLSVNFQNSTASHMITTLAAHLESTLSYLTRVSTRRSIVVNWIWLNYSPIVKRLQLDLRMRYYDDILMPGPTQIMAADVVMLVEAAPKLGLQVNASKCEIVADFYSVTRIMKIFDGFRETPPHELVLLGAPIVKGKAVDEALNKKVEALERTNVSTNKLLHQLESRYLLMPPGESLSSCDQGQSSSVTSSSP